MKTIYEAPDVQVVEVKMEGVICGSAKNLSIMMLLDGESLSSESAWERDGYGEYTSF